ncbi:YlmC/YmxH family sporulation protein [Dehalobacterium formicoaceticum]|uniref:YlmC/YmxH family sporulation protein n=1 Tax=Dehalobacterium formicoaceticum TaxID=51515 RepID=A0ABT1Y732_9FIRM|nr:YlmC/YmxH family sporulation protein [Dehalobacterium formicoaceticum]MCR6545905.1 YlmC/YmxH family sporulation protein [Dehalobacterium formicoaceticum]
MRLSELVGKKIVNVYDGEILGTIGDSDLVIDPFSGGIESIILPNKSHLLNLWFQKQQLIIPWESVKKVGSEVVVVDLDESHGRMW